MTFSDKVTTLTREVLLPKVVDNVLSSNVLTFRLVGNGKKGTGYDVRKSIKYKNSGTASSFSGLDSFTASALDTKVKMIYDMRAVRQPISIGGLDAVANSGEGKVTDLLKENLEETEQELTDEIGDEVYGDGTGNSNKDLIGLEAIVDDGTNVSTIGSLSRTTYPVLNATRTASGGTVTLNKLSTLYSNIAGSGNKSTPTLMVSDETVWDLYEQLLTPTVRETYSMTGMLNVGVRSVQRERGLKGTAGFSAVTYKGIPYTRDEKATAQSVYMLNENWLDFYGWKADTVPELGYSSISLSSNTVEGEYSEEPMSQFNGFNWSGFNTTLNQFGAVADVILIGNLVSFQPRRHGVLTGVTTV